MKKKSFRIAILSLILVVAGVTYGFLEPKPDKDRVILELIQYVLNEGHYAPHSLDNKFSEDFYESYIERLDYSKRYFIQSDIDKFHPFNTLIDDQLKFGDLTFFDLTYKNVHKRIENTKEIYTEILSKPMNFSKDEYLVSDVDKLDFAKDLNELNERWRLYLKYNVLIRYTDALETQEKEIKDNPEYVVKTNEELEKEARKGVLKTVEAFNKRMVELTRDEWLSIYLNVLTAQFDPHTTYFAPKDKKRFDQSMSGQLEGIGARLQVKDSYITIIEVISGSPSWKQGDLEVEDKIIKVSQGNDGEAVNVVGMRLDDAVELIKGKKGTVVKLLVKKINGSKKEISITRDVVEIEETFAKSVVIQKNNIKYGLINLPKFYVNFNDKNARNSADDVEKEIIKLKKEGVEGIILDLRNNGGGSLQAAIKMSGLFIKDGPIVQVKSRDKDPEIYKDKDKSVLWSGPLVIMINQYSASASEILAAAMKDYGRAVIIGSDHSYGKGTVQNIWNLDNLINPKLDVKPLGAIKLTIQKFYRINGGATQLKGVESDVKLPNRYMYLDIGEKEQDNAMAWDTITPLKYKKWHLNNNIKNIKKKSAKRISESEQFILIDENAKWLKSRQEDVKASLNIDTYNKENEEFEMEIEKFKPISEYNNNLDFVSTKKELELVKLDSSLAGKRKRWHKYLTKDAYIEESVNILHDLN